MSRATISLRQFTSSTYLRAIALLSSGQISAALLPLAAAPILGRLYLPADYGALAAYMALSGLFGAVSTLQLHQGIIAERSEQRARELVLTATLVVAAIALVAAVVAMALFAGMATSETYASLRGWVLVLPLTVLSAGVTAAIASLANRRAAYGDLARIPVLAAVVTVVTSILLGVMGLGVTGLFISYFLGQAMSFVVHLNIYRRLEPERPRVGLRRLLYVGWRHRNFVRYTVPSQFLSVVSLDMPVYVLAATGSISLLGAFQRARALVSTPLSLIGGAVAQVFSQRASEQYRATGSCRGLYVRTGLGVFLLGLPPLVILMLWAPVIFRIVLGPNWGEAGEVARILAPMLLLRLVCSPLSTVFLFTGQQRLNFHLSVAALVLNGGLVLGVAFSEIEISWCIITYAVSYAIVYIMFLIWAWQLSEVHQ